MSDRFDVVQFFADGTYEYVRLKVTAEEAVAAAYHCSHSLGARLGTTARIVILTGAGDATNFEWRFGEGVVFPPREGATA